MVAILNLGELRSIRETLLSFSVYSLLIFAATGTLSRLFYTLRWQSINASIGMQKLSLAYLFRVGLLSEFVSIVLPSYLGGDGVRLIKLREVGCHNRETVFSILLDRIVGVLTLGILTAVFLPFLFPLLSIQLSISPATIAIVMVAGVVGLVAAITLSRRWKPARLSELTQGLQIQPKALLASLLYSILGHLIYVASYYVLFSELTTISLAPLFAVVFLALLTRTIPLSVFGIDISDGSVIFLMGLIGIQSSASLSVVALVILSRYFFSSCGLLTELIADGKQIFLHGALVD